MSFQSRLVLEMWGDFPGGRDSRPASASDIEQWLLNEGAEKEWWCKHDRDDGPETYISQPSQCAWGTLSEPQHYPECGWVIVWKVDT